MVASDEAALACIVAVPGGPMKGFAGGKVASMATVAFSGIVAYSSGSVRQGMKVVPSRAMSTSYADAKEVRL